jgi:peptidoglycan hydrolase-like protein with peptidoglycan-binding domain
VATWQAFAGLVPDGIYGPKTAKALRAFGAKSVVG